MRYRYQKMLGCLSLVIGCGDPAGAEPAVTTWTTYLYDGPGSHYVVVDEVPQATSIDLAGCNGGWCKAKIHGRLGFLRAEVVARGDASKPADGLLPQPAAAARETPPKGLCLEANQTGGNGGNAPTFFCLK